MGMFHWDRIICIACALWAPVALTQDGHSGWSVDRNAIEQLHARDAKAAKAGDVATLATLWTVDAVALPPGEPPVVGIDAIRQWLFKGKMDTSKFEVTEYAMDFQEVQIVGDEAFEWARTAVTIRRKGATAGMRASGNLMRVLRKQPDGSWKVARAAWNMERPVPVNSSR